MLDFGLVSLGLHRFLRLSAFGLLVVLVLDVAGRILPSPYHTPR